MLYDVIIFVPKLSAQTDISSYCDGGAQQSNKPCSSTTLTMWACHHLDRLNMSPDGCPPGHLGKLASCCTRNRQPCILRCCKQIASFVVYESMMLSEFLTWRAAPESFPAAGTGLGHCGQSYSSRVGEGFDHRPSNLSLCTKCRRWPPWRRSEALRATYAATGREVEEGARAATVCHAREGVRLSAGGRDRRQCREDNSNVQSPREAGQL